MKLTFPPKFLTYLKINDIYILEFFRILMTRITLIQLKDYLKNLIIE